jgi:glycosyltransferase involved in cell wall biosynthesis
VRIAYLINQYPTISHSFIRREIIALDQLGFEITRIALRGWDRELADDEDRLERERTRYVLRAGAPSLLIGVAQTLITRPIRLMRALALAWQMSRRSERPLSVHLAYVAEACRVEAWLRKADIKHLHAHFGTNSAEVAMLVHVLGGPPWSFTAHGPEEFEKAGSLGLAEKVRRCSFVVAISSYGRAQIYRLVEPRHWRKVHVVRCGVDPSFLATPTTAGGLPRQIVCVARLSREKGHLVLLEAAQRLAEQGIDFQLVLAGDGEFRPEIEADVAQRKLTDKVRLLGWLSGRQVRHEILTARALVLPSFAEGLPVVIMEAMALRRPVIATFVAGIPELVRPGANGWLVPASDVDALVEALRACLNASAGELSRMGETARECAQLLHDVNREAQELGRLFGSALAEAQRK